MRHSAWRQDALEAALAGLRSVGDSFVIAMIFVPCCSMLTNKNGVRSLDSSFLMKG